MPRFSKEVLIPGTYAQGNREITISANDCRDFYLSLDQIRRNGLHLPLILEHPPADRTDTKLGFPVESTDELLADELRRTVGFGDLLSTQTRLNERGGVEIEFDVPDIATAEQLADKRIRFVSPELVNYWQDGKGNEYRNLMTHVALTHRPVQIDQASGFVQLSMQDVPRGKVIQLSIEELVLPKRDEPITFGRTRSMTKKAAAEKKRRLNMAARLELAKIVNQLSSNDDNFEDDDDSNDQDNKPKGGDKGGSGGGNDNPDMPKTSGGGDKQFEALIAHLTKLGLALPSDTDDTNLVDRLLTAVMTFNAVNDANDAKDDDADNNGGGNTEELQSMGTQQFSSAQSRDRLVNRIRATVNLPAGIRDTLLVRAGTVQFSAAGEETVQPGSIGIGELLSSYEHEATQFSSGSPQSKMVDRLKALKDAHKITPGVHDQLLAKIGRLQFSDAGKEVAQGGLTMTEVLDNYEQSSSVVDSFLNGGTQLSGNAGGGNNNSGKPSGGERHPRGNSFLTGDQYLKSGQAESVQLSTAMIARAGLKPRDPSKRLTGINASNLAPVMNDDE